MNRNTLAAPVTLSGVGLHSGVENHMVLQPVTSGGIRFVCAYANEAVVPATVEAMSHTNRATVLKQGEVEVHTPEHLLSACFGLGITDLEIQITAPEIPILDGSALPFIKAFQEAGLSQVPGDLPFLTLSEPVKVADGDAFILAEPSDAFQVHFTLDYPDSFVGNKTSFFEFGSEAYVNIIAPSRTYGFEHEVNALRERGLIKGGSLDNALVIGETNYLTPLRHPREMTNHKILDVIGDLSVLGAMPQMRLTCMKSGHDLNMALAKALVSN